MPKGAFICIYVGNLFENEEGNRQGQNYGDEYFADLDLIEIVERNKEGYESDVSEDEGDNPVSKPPETYTSSRWCNRTHLGFTPSSRFAFAKGPEI